MLEKLSTKLGTIVNDVKGISALKSILFDEKQRPLSTAIRTYVMLLLYNAIIRDPDFIDVTAAAELNEQDLGEGILEDTITNTQTLSKVLEAIKFIKEIPSLANVRELTERIHQTIIPTFKAGPFPIKMQSLNFEERSFHAFCATKEIPSMFLALSSMRKIANAISENRNPHSKTELQTDDDKIKAKFNPKCTEGGLITEVISRHMTRSFGLIAQSKEQATEIVEKLKSEEVQIEMKKLADESTHHGKCNRDLEISNEGPQIYIKLYMEPGDAAGQNMTTRGAKIIGDNLEEKFAELIFNLLSINCCVDKKSSTENEKNGRGVVTRAQTIISKELITQLFGEKVTAEKLVNEYYPYKLKIPEEKAGVRGRNSSLANIILAMYLAYSQDAANTVEASQGNIDMALTENGDLWICCEIMAIVGTIGGGMSSPGTKERFKNSSIPLPEENNIKIGQSRDIFAQLVCAVGLLYELNIAASLMRPASHTRAHEGEKQSELNKQKSVDQIMKTIREIINKRYFRI